MESNSCNQHLIQVHQQNIIMLFFNVQLTFRLPYRDKLERLHSEEVIQRRRQYTKEDKDTIMRLLSAKEKTSSSDILKTSDEEHKEETNQRGKQY